MNKKLLALAIGMAASSAHAVVNLNAAAPGAPSVYASETVLAQTATTVSGVTYHNITDAATGATSVKSAAGFGRTANTSTWVRYDLTNALFENQVDPTDMAMTLATQGAPAPVITLAAGGAANSSYVIFEAVDANDAMLITDTFDLGGATGTLVKVKLATGQNATMRVRLYQSGSDAVNAGTTGMLSDTSNAWLSQTSGLTTTFTAASNPVADVDDGFTDFLGNQTEASLGTVELALTAGALDALTSLGPVTRAAILTDASAIFSLTGDLSYALPPPGTGVVQLRAANCGGGVAAALTVNAGGTAASLTGTGPIANATTYAICVTPDGTSTVPVAAPYTVSLTDPAAGTFYADTTGTLAGIDHNGTTLKIAYATTFTGYNQRLVITNNGSSAASYVINFETEAGVTATPGAAATGSLPAGQVTVVKMTDAVTFTGGSRGSAQVLIPAVSSTIQAAVTQVNQSDGSTDTVQLQ